MSTIQVSPVILCGGSGTRLWPLSRAGFPKQFLCLTGKDSLFQQAAKRLVALGTSEITVTAPLIVTNEEHRFLASEQLRESGIELGAALLEPVGRNTAPALTFAALQASSAGSDPILVVTPADHVIQNQQAFVSAMHEGVRQAADGAIVIMGITPDRPETGYGYIKTTAKLSSRGCIGVARFVEKPDAAAAKRYLAEGDYFWNAGLFVLKASVWLKALEFFRSDIHQAVRIAWSKRTADAAFIRPGSAEFALIPSDSIDYAVMERCPQSAFPIHMVQLGAGWSDVGAWETVWDVLAKDDAGNAHIGDVLSIGCSNTLVHSSSRLVSLVGVQDLVVVETPDAILVASKARSQDVKEIVHALGQRLRPEHVYHRKVHRPWGWYDSIDAGGRFKVKRIVVHPGASLSLQKHVHRAEHWIVVSGTAEVTRGDEAFLLSENQSAYIPLGQLHRLRNPGKIQLEIIEVQSGAYLGEDDIERVHDDFGRVAFPDQLLNSVKVEMI